MKRSKTFEENRYFKEIVFHRNGQEMAKHIPRVENEAGLRRVKGGRLTARTRHLFVDAPLPL